MNDKTKALLSYGGIATGSSLYGYILLFFLRSADDGFFKLFGLAFGMVICFIGLIASIICLKILFNYRVNYE